MEQVLNDLAVNARTRLTGRHHHHVAPAMSPSRIESAPTHLPAGGVHPRAEVADTGMGMSPEVPGADLRALLHHQGAGPGDRPGPRHLLRGSWKPERRPRSPCRASWAAGEHVPDFSSRACTRIASPTMSSLGPGKLTTGHADGAHRQRDELPWCGVIMRSILQRLK